MTNRRHITCPETGHLEEVELERTPLGLVVIGCSRFRGGGLDCPRECARRLDLREHQDVDDRERVLVVVSNLHDETAQIARMLGEELAADGLAVELAQLDAPPVPPLADYDAVVIGAGVRWGQHRRPVIDYIRDQRDALAALPAFFYSVGGHGVFDRDSYTRRMTRRTAWKPVASAAFGDAAPVQRSDVRELARQIADEIPPVLQPSFT